VWRATSVRKARLLVYSGGLVRRAVPGVSLHGFQELVHNYARGKNTPSNYQLQVRGRMQHLVRQLMVNYWALHVCGLLLVQTACAVLCGTFA
jgi:hypothetical protein